MEKTNINKSWLVGRSSQVIRPVEAEGLPMMVSLRGRCLEVMTCSEGAMDWMRMMGWLGS